MSIELVMLSNHLILCLPFLFLPSLFPSIRVFSNELALCIRWPKYWSFSFSISPSSEYSGLISFRIDWLDVLAVQGTLKSLPQHHSLKAWILILVLLLIHNANFCLVRFPITLLTEPLECVGFSSSVCSVQFSRSVMSNSLRPHESQHARPPYPSPTPGVYPNSCPSSQWWHPTISSSVVPFSSYPQSLPASGSFPISQLFAWGGQSIGVSASASVLPMNTQDWSPLRWTGRRSTHQSRGEGDILLFSFAHTWLLLKFTLFQRFKRTLLLFSST